MTPSHCDRDLEPGADHPEACLDEARAAFLRGDLDATCRWLQLGSRGLAKLARVDRQDDGPYAGDSTSRERLSQLRNSIRGLLDEIETQAGETRRELELLRTRRSNTEDSAARWFESRA